MLQGKCSLSQDRAVNTAGTVKEQKKLKERKKGGQWAPRVLC